MKEILRKSNELCVWFLQNLSNLEILKELIIECKQFDMSYIVTGLMKTAVASLAMLKNEEIEQMYEKLVNCCFQLMNEYQGKKQLLHLLFRILDILAENSLVAVEVLLRMQGIGKILLYINEKKIIVQESYENLSKQTEFSNFKEESEVQGNASQVPEELYDEGTVMQFIEYYENKPNHSNLIKCLIRLIEKTDFSLDEINSNNFQGNCIVSEKQYWERLFMVGTTKSVWNYLSKLFVKVCLNNLERTIDYEEVMDSILEKVDDKILKGCLINIEAMVCLDDQFQSHRIQALSQILIKAIKQSLNYYNCMLFFQKYLIKICNQSKLFYEHCFDSFQNDEDLLIHIKQWFDNAYQLKDSLENQKLEIFKNREAIINEDKFFRCIKTIEYKIRILKNKFLLLFQTKANQIAQYVEYNSDEDTSEWQIIVQQRLDFMKLMKDKLDFQVNTYVITDTIEDLFKLTESIGQAEKPISLWLRYDTEQIGPERLMKNYYDQNNVCFYQ
eukprot:TRINITY_DN7652_c0_g1_i2.p1 TRINITY_DN7652_c0_g1~~TRINITY_DN7652_c0_g1_i2.p1  ORF type:complete len:501 (-),score=68.14 TRINITY_DN7652_c0_g1_i2:162-1664(-)